VIRFRSAVFVALLLVAGCYRTVRLDVEQLPDGRLSIDATERSWSFKGPCIEQAWLYRIGSERRVELWSIALRDTERCVSSFTYPEVPVGYEMVVPLDQAAAPRSGDQLEIEVRGTAFDGVTQFVKS
jgi:hypothetical protein